MNRVDRNAFEQASSWSDDLESARERSQRRAWLIVWLLGAIVVLEGLALIALVPLKSVVPYTILVDRQTGYVTTLDPARPSLLGADQALTRSMLVQYVAAREGYSLARVRDDYRKVMSWSSGTARASYARDMAPTSPDSPVARFGRNGIAEVVPKSVSELAGGSSLVRFDLVEISADGRRLPARAFAAVIDHRLQPRAMSVEERFINPLGFEVTRYRRDPEAAPPVVTSAVPAASPFATTPDATGEPAG
jgi:type IV secretion system protein VirB8